MALCNPGYISPDWVLAAAGHFKMVHWASDPWLNQRTTCVLKCIKVSSVLVYHDHKEKCCQSFARIWNRAYFYLIKLLGDLMVEER